MDLANAARAPKPTQARRTHAPAPADELGESRAHCGARLAGIAVNDGAPEDTTCCACRASLHRDGTLPYVRRPRA